MKLYPFLLTIGLNEDTSILFNPISQDILYYDAIKYDNIHKLINDIAPLEFSKCFLGESSYSQFFHKIVGEKQIIDNQNVEFRTLKMFITTRCNLNCKYCLIENNLRHRRAQSSSISIEKAHEVIDNFILLCNQQPHSAKTVMLYGGEPLINWGVLKNVIKYIRDKELNNAFNGPVELILETNGTLVTSEIANVLAQYNVFAIVSIDGVKDVHDYYRKDYNQNGTWELAIRGYQILREHNCTAVISSVFTEKFADNYISCLEYMHNELKTPSIGLNLIHFIEDDSLYNENTINYLDKYILAFEKASELGLYVEHIMRRIRPLVEKKIRIKDCGACGKRIVSDCDANFGVCEAFIGDGNFFYNRANIYSLYDDATIKEWSRRTILGIPSCKSCFAQSICGGGCVSNAIKVFGSIWAPDIYICKSSKLLVKWAFNRWFMDNDIANKLKNKGVYYLSDEERKSILHNLKLTYDIPLQTMSKQNELKNE